MTYRTFTNLADAKCFVAAFQASGGYAYILGCWDGYEVRAWRD